MITRYHFEDQGQDLLWFDVQAGKIIGAGPYHNALYAGTLAYEFYKGKPVKVGGKVGYTKSLNTPVQTIKYPVVKIEQRIATEDAVASAVADHTGGGLL